MLTLTKLTFWDGIWDWFNPNCPGGTREKSVVTTWSRTVPLG